MDATMTSSRNGSPKKPCVRTIDVTSTIQRLSRLVERAAAHPSNRHQATTGAE